MELDAALSMFGGMTTIVGGFLLLYKGKIALGTSNQPVLTFDSVKFGKITTTSATLGLFIVGAALLVLPLGLMFCWNKEKAELQYLIDHPKTVTIRAPFMSEEFPVILYAADKNTVLDNAQDGTLEVPVFKGMDGYQVIYTAGHTFTTMHVEREQLMKGEPFVLRAVAIQKNNTAGMPKDRNAYQLLESTAPGPAFTTGY